ncbi:MAG TPA: S4 domain-containing protein, partial [Mycobacterium sp.]|nr:S4 domain-containing protein [Mycobacterium sp.]
MMVQPEESRGTRLQKVLSQAGIASRRAAEKLIIDGRVEV